MEATKDEHLDAWLSELSELRHRNYNATKAQVSAGLTSVLGWLGICFSRQPHEHLVLTGLVLAAWLFDLVLLWSMGPSYVRGEALVAKIDLALIDQRSRDVWRELVPRFSYHRRQLQRTILVLAVPLAVKIAMLCVAWYFRPAVT
jgi:hypothetical protein